MCNNPYNIGPSRGIPNILAAQNDHVARLSAVPTAEEAIDLFTADGGHLSSMSPFGIDPLSQHPTLINQRQRVMEQCAGIPSEIFGSTVNGDFAPFSQALQCMIDTTKNLQHYV